ncbi:hypothetical protein Poli38472_000931 [Pythium oligandrum]|uniref:Calponin-homology (CH) domain-containing protein n=1 Tax=Pythium oligandrum TaxID=41045 RepID=A0A8K1CD68_PYTOL|nr:hypothetical protein Poli38472_000931 [Pythium oligandrum]|eukprot:TMW60889.1 hypothetical protein Poli38472_000931 [Pythium oligandrum]
MSIRKLKSRGIGRLELLAWLNELLETDYTKIEHLADGIAYCQIFDALHPGKVSLQQVNFRARSVSDYERNFQVLRKAFHACDIRKEIPIRKLVDGVFQEHFEFLHWIHDYVHKTYPEAVHKYGGFARRQQVLGSTGNGNMNLVPSYSMSSKIPNEAYISSPVRRKLDMIDPEEVEASLEDLAASESPIGTSKEEVNAPAVPPEVKDPLLAYVKDSQEHTIRATDALAQLHRLMSMVLVEPTIQKKLNSKSKPGQQKAQLSKKDQPKKPSAEPPLLAPQLGKLIDVLTAELQGRAQDMMTLEATVNDMAQTLEQRAKGTPPSSTTPVT